MSAYICPFVGRQRGIEILILVIPKLKIKNREMSRGTRYPGQEFRLAPFVFPPWQERKEMHPNLANKIERLKKEREGTLSRTRELRHQLTLKEKQLKQLKETKEPAPRKEFMERLASVKARKSVAEAQVAQLKKNVREVAKEIRGYEKEIDELRKEIKNRYNVARYYGKMLATGAKAKAAQRKHAHMAERLAHEKREYKALCDDTALLVDECADLESTIGEYGAVFVSKIGGKHRPEVLEVIFELLDIGIPIESIQTIFEVVYQCVNFPLHNFPTIDSLKKMKRMKNRESETNDGNE